MLHSVQSVCFADFLAAPKAEAEVYIRQYHGWNQSNEEILKSLRQHFDLDHTYSLGSVTRSTIWDATDQERRKSTLKLWLKEWGLKSTKAQAHTFQTIAAPIAKLRKQFPTAGAATMRDHLRIRFNMRVPRYALVPTPPY